MQPPEIDASEMEMYEAEPIQFWRNMSSRAPAIWTSGPGLQGSILFRWLNIIKFGAHGRKDVSTA
jgi:hypothetical protein